jgi:hypothetical protein
MDISEINMRLTARLAAGKESACGLKFQHSTLEGAQSHADGLNKRPEVERGERHRTEPYPCPWCSPGVYEGQLIYDDEEEVYWHVGREMTPAVDTPD